VRRFKTSKRHGEQRFKEINTSVKESNAAILSANASYITYKHKEEEPKNQMCYFVIAIVSNIDIPWSLVFGLSR
jgi:hypothetical protein